MHAVAATTSHPASSPRRVSWGSIVLAALVPLLALGAGVIHLERYLMTAGAGRPSAPPRTFNGPPPGARPPVGAPHGSLVMSLVGPHLTQAFLLNFAGFVILAALFLALLRAARPLRAAVDVVLILMAAATLYAWNAMGHANPRGLGVWGLIAEGGLIILAAIHLVLLALPARSPARA